MPDQSHVAVQPDQPDSATGSHQTARGSARLRHSGSLDWVTAEDVKEAVFGSFDGITSALGVIAGLIVAGAHSGAHIVAADLGLAVAATVGMGAGEFLSDPDRSIRLAVVMGAATLVGSVAPAIPFATGYGTAQVLIAAAIVVSGGLVIGRLRGYRITFAVLTVVAVVTVGLSALVA